MKGDKLKCYLAVGLNNNFNMDYKRLFSNTNEFRGTLWLI